MRPSKLNLKTEKIEVKKTPQNSFNDSGGLSKLKPNYISITRKNKKDTSFCLCFSKRTKMTNEEKFAFENLKTESSEEFDFDSKDHFDLLHQVRDKYCEIEKKQISEFKWVDLGFQSNTPKNDLRSSGVIVLKFILFYIDNYQSIFQDSVHNTYFSFSLVCIKLVFLTRIYCRLFEEQEEKKLIECYKITPCTQKEKIVIAQMQMQNKNSFFLILSKAMIYLFHKFTKKFNPKKGEMNCLMLDVIVGSALKRLRRVIKKFVDKEERLVGKSLEEVSDEVFKININKI